MRVLMLGIVLAIAAAMPTTTSADDLQIAEFIKAKLLQEKQRGNLFGFNVDMRVDRGTVWFKGFVSNRSQELMILRTAQLAGHLGVVQVVDDIDVNEQFAENAEQPVEQPVGQPVVRQEVKQQRPAMTSITNQGQRQQMTHQQLQQQMMEQQAMEQQVLENQRLQHNQMLQQRQIQEQRMMPPPAPMQSETPKQTSRAEPKRAPMPMLPAAQAELENSAQPVAYQEPMFAPEMNRLQSPMQRPMMSNVPYQKLQQQYSGQSMEDPPVPAGSWRQSATTQTRPPMRNEMTSSGSSDSRMSTPIRTVSSPSQPLPFARAAAAVQGCEMGGCGGMAGGPMMADGGYGGSFGGYGGDTGITSDSANLPGYAWPAYAAHPNYGAVSYPKQYSPSAWPYIGPFYPYPQVPLGWRKVALEWDDGWWYLDFDDKN